jgi:hypothetical protein
MKRTTASLSLMLLLFAASNRCLAEMGIVEVSRERAREFGIDVRSTQNGPDEIWVELEFKPEGKLKNFKHVSLEIRDQGMLLLGYAPLGEKRPKSGSVVVGFLVNRSYLDKVTLSVVTGFPMNLTGHELRLREFVGPTKRR